MDSKLERPSDAKDCPVKRSRPTLCAREGCGAPRSRHQRGRVGPVLKKGDGACLDGWGWAGGIGWFVLSDRVECTCPGFLAPEKETPKKGRGSHASIRSYGIAAQCEWAKVAAFANREGHGADSVYFGPDGEALLLSEHKHRPAPTYWEVDMDQARDYSLRERGRPFPVVGYTSKPGPGKAARRYLVMDAADWPQIVDRLVGQ